jgi:hypothetical protein
MQLKLPALILALAIAAVGVSQALAIPIGKPALEISGTSWINSPALNASDLKGRVVLVEFWTYG